MARGGSWALGSSERAAGGREAAECSANLEWAGGLGSFGGNPCADQSLRLVLADINRPFVVARTTAGWAVVDAPAAAHRRARFQRQALRRRDGLLFVAGSALLGYGDLREAPELALLVLAFNSVLPMAAWMRFRGMAWRPTLEMSGATVGLAVAMIGLDWFDVVQQSTVRGGCSASAARRAWSCRHDAVPPGAVHRPDGSSDGRTRQAHRARGLRFSAG